MKGLSERGWRVSPSSQEAIPTSAKDSLAWALRTDIKEFGEAFVVDWVNTAQEDAQARQWLTVPPEGLVLQVSRVRNVAAPKIKEDAASVPKLHKISLTDGHGICHAIEKRRIESLSSKIPPGTKIRLQPGQRIQCKSGFLLLEPAHVEVLGGKVEALVEKWAITQELAHFTRAKPAGVGGPPPWVAFGKRIGGETPAADAGFKALPKGEADKDGVIKESVEFESQRKDAIEEAAKQGGKKVFGGGTKEVKDGDRRQHNNRHANKASEGDDEPSGSRGGRGRGGGRGGRGRRGGNHEDEEDESGFASSRPSTGVSLFSFLEKELPESAKNPVDRDPRPNRQGGHAQTGSQRHNHQEQPSREFHGGNNSRRDRGGGHFGRDDGHLPEGNRRDGGNHRDNGNHRDTNQRDANHRDGNQRGKNKRGRGRDQRESHPQSRQNEVAPRHERQGRGGGSGGGGNRSNHDRESHGSFHPTNEPQPRNSNDSSKRGGKRGRGSRQPQDDRDFGEWENSTYTNAKSHPPPPHHGLDHRAPPPYSMNDLSDMMHGVAMNHQQPPPPLAPPPSHQVDPHVTNYGAPPIATNGDANRGQRGGGRSSGGQSNAKPRLTSGRTWKEGDLCMAKYWEDGQFYTSQVTAVGQNTVVVLFPEYGNHEEVLLQDLKPVPGSGNHRGRGGGGGFAGRGRYPNQAHPSIAATPGLPPAFPSN